MKTIKTLPILYYWFTCILFTLISCDKVKDAIEGGEDEEDGIALIFEKTEFSQAELVEVPFEGSYDKSKMKVNIAGKELEMIKRDNSFIFMIPIDISGEVELRSEGFDHVYNLTINSTGPNEADPDKYMENVFVNQAKQIDALQEGLDSLVSYGLLTQSAANQHKIIYTDSLAKKRNEFKSLSADQKQLAIKFTKGNFANIQEIDNLISKQLRPTINKLGQLSRKEKVAYAFQTNCNETDFIKKTKCIIVTELIPLTWKIASGILLAYGAIELSTLSGFGVLPGLAVGGALFYFKIIPAAMQLKSALWEIGNASLIYVGEVSEEIRASTRMDLMAVKGQKAETNNPSNLVEFDNYIKKKLDFKLKLRNLQPGLDQDQYAELFSAFNRFTQVWNLPLASKLFGPKPSWPIEKSKLSYISDIKNLNVYTDNTKVSGKISGTPKALEITFQTKENEDQNFNYSLSYNDGTNQVSTANKAGKLNFISDDYTIELYKSIGMFNPNNVNYYSNKQGPLIKTLKPGDDLTVHLHTPYQMIMKYKGEIVKTTNQDKDYFTYYKLGDSIGFREKDYYLPANIQQFEDLTNGRPVRFPVNITLSNELYRTIVNKTLVMKSGTSTLKYKLLPNLKVDPGYNSNYTYAPSSAMNSYIQNNCHLVRDYDGNFGVLDEGDVIGYFMFDFNGGNPCCVPRGTIAVLKSGKPVAIGECGFRLSLE